MATISLGDSRSCRMYVVSASLCHGSRAIRVCAIDLKACKLRLAKCRGVLSPT